MRRILFLGELPPFTNHGIANANSINLKILESHYHIDKIEERVKIEDHGKISASKTLNYLKNNLLILGKVIINRYDYMYLTYSLSSFGSIKTFSAILIFRMFNRGKIILHIHRGDFFTRFYKSRFNQIITKFIFSLSYKLIVLSQFQKNEFIQRFKKPIDVLTNTVDFELNPSKQIFSASKFIFISNYFIEKGILDLLEVFYKISVKHPGLYLQTYGSFQKKFPKEKLLRFNSSNISVNESITGLNKYNKIAESDCLVLPSWNEGQPVILLEAMSVGTPIIASKVGLIPDLLGPDYPFLCNPGDRDSLEKILLDFIAYQNISDISETLRRRYQSFYSQKVHYQELMRIFNCVDSIID